MRSILDDEAWYTFEVACAAAAEHLKMRFNGMGDDRNLHWTIKDRWAISLLLRKLEGKTE